MHNSKYGELIGKIKKKRKRVLAWTIVAVVLTVILASPAQCEIMGETVIDYKGLPPVLIVLLIILGYFIGVIAYVAVSMPLTSSMDQECDPEKNLVLNMELNKQKDIDYIYSLDYLYMGIYQASMEYSEKMIQSPKEQMVLAGLFNRARCEFLLGDNEAFIKTTYQYESALLNSHKLNAKVRLAYQKIDDVLYLMRAIAEENVEKINELRGKVEAWNTNSKATEGFLNYIKGVSAYKVEDKEEAIYRFKIVKEHCSKTVFSELSDNYLSLLK